MGAMTDEYDVVVIGAGPVGENVAQYAIAGSDRTAVLVERELVGGECSYFACMPSKALLRPIDVHTTSRHVRGLTPATLEVAEVLARRDRSLAAPTFAPGGLYLTAVEYDSRWGLPDTGRCGRA